jgi:hypothetical protein
MFYIFNSIVADLTKSSIFLMTKLMWESANANANDTLFINKIARILEKYGMHTPMELLIIPPRKHMGKTMALHTLYVFHIFISTTGDIPDLELFYIVLTESIFNQGVFRHCFLTTRSIALQCAVCRQFQCLPERISSIAVYALTGAEPIEVTLDKYCINLFFGIARLDSTIEKQMLLWESANANANDF